jgi:hypothetical protein
MSVQALTWALATATPSPTTKLVLILLANRAHPTGVTWPSVRKIAKESGFSERTVRYAIQTLITAGLLIKRARFRDNGSQTSDLYSLCLPSAEPFDDAEELDMGGGISCKPPLQELQAPLAPVAYPEPKTKPKTEPKKTLVQSDPEGFALWWETYPRKAAKLKAVEAYRKTLAQGLARAEELLVGAQAYAQARAGQDPQFTKLPTTWLSGGCWADELAAPSPPRNGGGVAVRESGLDWAASRLASEAMQ